MRRSLALGAGLAAGVAALAIVTLPGAAGAVSGAASRAVCTATGSTCPVADGQGPWWADGDANGTGMMGRRGGGMMNGAGAGNGYGGGMMNGRGMMSASDLGDGSLTADQEATVASMAEEEKLAHDVYTALAARYPSDPRFERIAASETQHLNALRRVMDAYGIADPTAGLAAGQFATASVGDLYDELLAKATSLDAALVVGQTIEKKDIADLDAAMASVTKADDVDSVYSHLRMASQHHLAAFGG